VVNYYGEEEEILNSGNFKFLIFLKFFQKKKTVQKAIWTERKKEKREILEIRFILILIY
jgi:hypothetical protein